MIALFGGGFDPPHLGHREAVRGLFERPGVKKVLILPSATPPHKSTWATPEARVEMARLNFIQPSVLAPLPTEIELDLRELNRAQRQPQRPSFTYDTLQEFRSLSTPVAFVIGADQLEQLPTWHRFPEVLALSHWIILERKQSTQENARRILSTWESSGLIELTSNESVWKVSRSSFFITLVSTPAPAISSTKIRESIVRTGAPPADTLLPDVLAYLKVRKLYGIQ